MALPFYNWSRTAASNASADSTVNWAEGQAPSSVNDSARAMMASTAAFRDDIAGAIATGGTSTAYTVTSYQIFDTLAHLSGQVVAFTPHTTNTAASPTLNVDSLGAKTICTAPSTPVQSGVLIQGTPYAALYNNSDGVFYLFGVGSAPSIPLLAGLDYWDTTTPGSAWIFPAGQAISRTTYAAAFARWGTTYGTGDGSTTFNVPDKTERVSVMKAAVASRLTSTYFGGDSTALGAVGGGESKTLITVNLPAYTPSGTVISSVTGGTKAGTGAITNYSVGGVTTAPIGAADILVGSTFTGSAQGGTSTPIRTVQPTIVCNYILRIA